MAKRVYTGCRDCRKCSISGFGKVGRDTGRGFAALATVGMSELALAATKDCGVCGHALSLHEDEKVTGWKQEAARKTAPNPAPVKPRPAVTNAVGHLEFSATGQQLWEVVVASYEPDQIKKQDVANRRITIVLKRPGIPTLNGTIAIESGPGTALLDYKLTPSFTSQVSAGEGAWRIERLNAAMRDEAKRLTLRVESALGQPVSPLEQDSAKPAVPQLEPAEGSSPAQTAPVGNHGLVEQIQRLADLHSQGALTAEEFAVAKAKLLG